jgi:hypothetical protein
MALSVLSNIGSNWPNIDSSPALMLSRWSPCAILWSSTSSRPPSSSWVCLPCEEFSSLFAFCFLGAFSSPDSPEERQYAWKNFVSSRYLKFRYTSESRRRIRWFLVISKMSISRCSFLVASVYSLSFRFCFLQQQVLQIQLVARKSSKNL